VVVFEAAVYWLMVTGLGAGRALLVSLVANVLSFTVGYGVIHAF
jgi:hypothetical protein